MAAGGYEHAPVLVAEVMDGLAVRADGLYMDGTFGRGGHTRALLARLGPGGRVVAIDKDPQAVACGRALAAEDPRLAVEHGDFAAMTDAAKRHGVHGRLAGLVLDLGVSSPQLDDPERGFSFQSDGPLDMRMDPTTGESAAEWLARAGEAEIASVLKDYGEERHARRIARAIVSARAEAPITTTGALARIVAGAQPGGRGPGTKHPATRAFQALRMQVNREPEALASALAQIPELLAPGGRVAIISFNSLEDRPVKRFFRERSRGATAPKGMPVVPEGPAPTLRVIGRAIRAGDAEVRANPRARSAVLRIAERLP